MSTNDFGMVALSAEEMEAVVGGSDGYMAEKIGYAVGAVVGAFVWVGRSIGDGPAQFDWTQK
ncbi:MAG TPA: hypothetical protein VF263_20500 [Longimicrobiaceae bacterium]